MRWTTCTASRLANMVDCASRSWFERLSLRCHSMPPSSKMHWTARLFFRPSWGPSFLQADRMSRGCKSCVMCFCSCLRHIARACWSSAVHWLCARHFASQFCSSARRLHFSIPPRCSWACAGCLDVCIGCKLNRGEARRYVLFRQILQHTAVLLQTLKLT